MREVRRIASKSSFVSSLSNAIWRFNNYELFIRFSSFSMFSVHMDCVQIMMARSTLVGRGRDSGKFGNRVVTLLCWFGYRGKLSAEEALFASLGLVRSAVNCLIWRRARMSSPSHFPPNSDKNQTHANHSRWVRSPLNKKKVIPIKRLIINPGRYIVWVLLACVCVVDLKSFRRPWNKERHWKRYESKQTEQISLSWALLSPLQCLCMKLFAIWRMSLVQQKNSRGRRTENENDWVSERARKKSKFPSRWAFFSWRMFSCWADRREETSNSFGYWVSAEKLKVERRNLRLRIENR